MVINRLKTRLSQFLIALALLFTANQLQAAVDGAAIYQNNCASCHKIDEKLVGPALKGVHERKDEAWLIKWIRNSQAVINAGDEYGKKLYAEYNNVQMPAFNLSDEEIKGVLAYIKEEGAKVATPAAGAVAGQENTGPVDTSNSKYYVLLWTVISLLVAVTLLSIRVLNKQYKLKGQKLINWNAVNGTIFLVFMIAFFYFVYYHMAKFGNYTLPEAASEHGVLIDKMLMITLAITFFVFIVTHILLFSYAYRYRGSENRRASYYHDNSKLEFFWTIIPAFVLTALVLYGFMVWTDVTQRKPNQIPTEIELFAYQFGWKSRYPGADKVLGAHDFRQIGSGNDLGIDSNDTKGKDDIVQGELVIPVGKPVLLKFRARDVIHSAYLPHFRVQMNVVPGMPTEFYFTPTITTKEMRSKLGDSNFDYILLCNKICGAAHFNMKMKVSVVSEKEYAQWITEQKPYFTPTVTTVAQNIQ